MTVSYNKDVISNSFMSMDNNMIKLLFRWKGSVYKLIIGDCIGFLIIYTIISLVYRLGLEDDDRKRFEDLVVYFNKFTKDLPLSWMLGFYIGVVVKRWWDQFKSIPWPDSLAFRINAAIKTTDEQSKMTRRTIIRYVNCGITLALMRLIDSSSSNPFNTLDDLVKEGLLREDEKELFGKYHQKLNKSDKLRKKKSNIFFKFNSDDCRPKSYEEYWVPLTWAISLIKTAKAEGLIKDEFVMRAMIGEIISIRNDCNNLLVFDWVNIPLAYTQVVTIAVYSFFLGSLLGGQELNPLQNIAGHTFDFFFPFLTILKFIFYIGWLKVAETLLNPFGGDDEDFEIVYLIKRNKQAGYAIVDDLVVPHPKLMRDADWGIAVTEQDVSNVELRKDLKHRMSAAVPVSQLPKDAEDGKVLIPITENS